MTLSVNQNLANNMPATSVLQNLAQNMPATSVLQNLADNLSNAWSSAQSAYQNSIGAGINNSVDFGLNGSSYSGSNGGSGSNGIGYYYDSSGQLQSNGYSDSPANDFNGVNSTQGYNGVNSNPSDMPGATAASTANSNPADIPGSSSYGSYSNGTTPIDQVGGDSTPLASPTPLNENTAPASDPLASVNDPGTAGASSPVPIPTAPTVAPMVPSMAAPSAPVDESDGLNTSVSPQPAIPDASNESAGLNMSAISAANDPTQLNTAPAPGSTAATNTWASSVPPEALANSFNTADPNAPFSPTGVPLPVAGPGTASVLAPSGASPSAVLNNVNDALNSGVPASTIAQNMGPTVQNMMAAAGYGEMAQNYIASQFAQDPQGTINMMAEKTGTQLQPQTSSGPSGGSPMAANDAINASPGNAPTDTPWGTPMNAAPGNATAPADTTTQAPYSAPTVSDIASLAPVPGGNQNTAVPDSQSSQPGYNTTAPAVNSEPGYTAPTQSDVQSLNPLAEGIGYTNGPFESATGQAPAAAAQALGANPIQYTDGPYQATTAVTPGATMDWATQNNVPLPQTNPNTPAADAAQDAAQDAGWTNARAAPGIEDAVNMAANLPGITINANDLGAMTGIESDFGNKATQTGSYIGAMQMGANEFATGMRAAMSAGYTPAGGPNGDINNTQDNIVAAAYQTQTLVNQYTNSTGVSASDVTPADLYGMHQQGAAGWAAYTNNPDQSAVQSLINLGVSNTPTSGTPDGKATDSVLWNLPPSLKGTPVSQVTGAMFQQATNNWFYSKGGTQTANR